MAEAPNLTNLSNLQNDSTATSTINSNNAAIVTAFTDVLSRSGVAPNQMQANLDMNGNNIINLPVPSSNFSPVRLIDVNTINSGGITVSNLPVGGTTGQVLTKNTGANFDVSWQTKFPFIYTPELFGAVGDGVTNDTAAINSAIAAATGSSKGIIVLTQKYAITSTINITTAGTTIIGTGVNSGFNPAAGITAINVSIPLNAGVILRDFSINFSALGANQIGIQHQCSNAAQFTGPTQIDGITIINARLGINLINFAGPGSVRNCWILGFDGQGIFITAPANVDGGDFCIENNTISTATTNTVGIAWQTGGGVRIINNKFAGVMLIAIDLNIAASSSCSLALITGNSFEGMLLYGIRFIRTGTVSTFINAIINGNEFELNSPATTGIIVVTDAGSPWVTNLNIVNNIIYQGTNVTFVDLSNTVGFTVSHNIIRSGGGTKIINTAATSDQGVVGPNAHSGTTVASTISSTNTTTISPT